LLLQPPTSDDPKRHPTSSLDDLKRRLWLAFSSSSPKRGLSLLKTRLFADNYPPCNGHQQHCTAVPSEMRRIPGQLHGVGGCGEQCLSRRLCCRWQCIIILHGVRANGFLAAAAGSDVLPHNNDGGTGAAAIVWETEEGEDDAAAVIAAPPPPLWRRSCRPRLTQNNEWNSWDPPLQHLCRHARLVGRQRVAGCCHHMARQPPNATPEREWEK
jgi:hypothetical protein